MARLSTVLQAPSLQWSLQPLVTAVYVHADSSYTGVRIPVRALQFPCHGMQLTPLPQLRCHLLARPLGTLHAPLGQGMAAVLCQRTCLGGCQAACWLNCRVQVPLVK
jgi:hypothetical protein